MNLAALLIPPSLDAKQALRLRRFGISGLSYVLATALVAVGWAFGVLPASTVLEAAAAFVLINLGLYAVIRSGYNLRFEDPSLTRFQMLAAMTVLMYIVYRMDDGRPVALSACFIVFLFGIFRLSARQFTVVTLYTLAAYALVINLLMHLRPQVIHDVPSEWMSWLALAGFLPCFTLIGGQINALRLRMRESEARFRSLIEMSSDFYWESDADHRLTGRNSADKKGSTVSVFRQGAQIGERRWEIPHLSPDEAGWRVHRADLDSHRPFRDFELSRLGIDGTERHIAISGDPVFDAAGAFKGYRGIGHDFTERKLANSALRESEARFRSLAGMSSDFYWESDAEHRLTQRGSANKKAGAASLFRHITQIGDRRWETPGLSPDEAGWRAHRAELDAHRPFRDFEISRLGTDGTERFLSLSGDPMTDASGAFKGYRGVGTDITARKRAEQALRDSAQQLRLFADNVPAMTAYWDLDLRCRFASKALAEFYGLAAEEMVGKHMRELMGEEVYRDGETYAVQVRQGRPVTYQRKRTLKNGEIHYLEMRLLPHFADHGKVVGCFAVTIDITEHKLVEERFQRIAHHDSLTGLPNRLLFNDRLSQAISLAKRDTRQFALLYLDLDRFKSVNDALGHIAGDELLQAVTARIRREVRESDTLARVGGDEFTLILPDIAGREEAETVAAKIIAVLAAPFQLGDQKHSVEIGASIGIALYPADARDADALVKAADDAMYSVKQAGNALLSTTPA